MVMIEYILTNLDVERSVPYDCVMNISASDYEHSTSMILTTEDGGGSALSVDPRGSGPLGSPTLA